MTKKQHNPNPNWGGARPGAGPKPLSLYERAGRRIDRSIQLQPHRAYILADWPEGDRHLRWVLTATVKEILDWVAAGNYPGDQQ